MLSHRDESDAFATFQLRSDLTGRGTRSSQCKRCPFSPPPIREWAATRKDRLRIGGFRLLRWINRKSLHGTQRCLFRTIRHMRPSDRQSRGFGGGNGTACVCAA